MVHHAYGNKLVVGNDSIEFNSLIQKLADNALAVGRAQPGLYCQLTGNLDSKFFITSS